MTDILKFTALITYVQPTAADLRKVFNWAIDFPSEPIYEPIDACKDVSRETREIEFILWKLNRFESTTTLLAELDLLELRPALYEELLGFINKYPLLSEIPPDTRGTIALGSVCQCYGGLWSPIAVDSESGTGIDRMSLPSRIGLCRILAVRK